MFQWWCVFGKSLGLLRFRMFERESIRAAVNQQFQRTNSVRLHATVVRLGKARDDRRKTSPHPGRVPRQQDNAGRGSWKGRRSFRRRSGVEEPSRDVVRTRCVKKLSPTTTREGGIFQFYALSESLEEKNYQNVRCVERKVFSVAHYTGTVTYEFEEMPERNRDFLPPEIISVMRFSSDSIVRMFFANTLNKTGNLNVFFDEVKPNKNQPREMVRNSLK